MDNKVIPVKAYMCVYCGEIFDHSNLEHHQSKYCLANPEMHACPWCEYWDDDNWWCNNSDYDEKSFPKPPCVGCNLFKKHSMGKMKSPYDIKDLNRLEHLEK